MKIKGRLHLSWKLCLALGVCGAGVAVGLAVLKPVMLRVDENMSACVSEVTGEALQTLGVEAIWPEGPGGYVVTIRRPGTLRARAVRVSVGTETKQLFELRRVGERSYEAQIPTGFFARNASGGKAMCKAITVSSLQAALRATDK